MEHLRVGKNARAAGASSACDDGDGNRLFAPAKSDRALQSSGARAVVAVRTGAWRARRRARFPACPASRPRGGVSDPVLFVHGTDGPSAYWAPLLAGLGSFRCLLLDRPGWALSSPIDFRERDYGELVAGVLRGTLDGLGVERAHVVGGSIGTTWALRLAERHSDRVDRVVLLGGGPLVSEVPVPLPVRLIVSPLGSILVRIPRRPAGSARRFASSATAIASTRGASPRSTSGGAAL
jgi:pimeloyl-ACP methyl ester carboxylesterase